MLKTANLQSLLSSLCYVPVTHQALKFSIDDHETGAFTAESNLKAIGLDMEIDTA